MLTNQILIEILHRYSNPSDIKEKKTIENLCIQISITL
jgi:hypothetical protein